MKKNFIKMNNNQNQLSLGNFCRIVKELAQNKSFANQTEVFYCLFDVDDVSDSTINNYCIGYRAIGTEFRQLYIKYKNNYHETPEIFDGVITGLMSILDGEVHYKFTHDELLVKTNNHPIFNKLILELYNLAKNDQSVSDNFTEDIYRQISENKIYQALCDILIYIVLEKKQPVYTETSQKEVIENILNNTNISVSELEKFLKLQMQDGINYTHSLKKLAKERNPYACYEMGELEYTGAMVGYPRYIKSYEYFKIATEKNHPRASWLIAQMIYQKKIGDLSKDDLKLAWNYLKKAEKVGSVAATNTIGVCYLNGLVPDEPKSEKKAIEYFKKAISYDYVYAYNNLGKIYEKKGDYKKAFKYFLFGADKEESWACNKVGEYYRTGIASDIDMEKAFKYYNLATEVPLNILDHWAFYNLAKYFYLNGNVKAHIEKNVAKATKYFKTAAQKGIMPAYEELIYIYIDKYKESDSDYHLNKINEYLNILAKDKYYDKCKDSLKNKLKEIEKKHLALVKLI